MIKKLQPQQKELSNALGNVRPLARLHFPKNHSYFLRREWAWPPLVVGDVSLSLATTGTGSGVWRILIISDEGCPLRQSFPLQHYHGYHGGQLVIAGSVYYFATSLLPWPLSMSSLISPPVSAQSEIIFGDSPNSFPTITAVIYFTGTFNKYLTRFI